MFTQLCFVWRLCLFLNNATQRTLRKSPGCDRQASLLFIPSVGGKSKEGKRKGRKEKEAPLEPLPCPSHQPRGFAQLNFNSSFQGFVGALTAPEDSHSSVLRVTFFSNACQSPAPTVTSGAPSQTDSSQGLGCVPHHWGARARHEAARAPAAGNCPSIEDAEEAGTGVIAFYVAAEGVHLDC